jgi:hypothetical protein
VNGSPGPCKLDQSTVRAVARKLTSADGELVYRIHPDGLEGEEGALSTCTFWLAQARWAARRRWPGPNIRELSAAAGSYLRRPLAPRFAAFLADFLAPRLAVFFALLLAGRRAAFLAAFRAAFLAGLALFLAAFLAPRLAAFLAAFLDDFLAVALVALLALAGWRAARFGPVDAGWLAAPGDGAAGVGVTAGAGAGAGSSVGRGSIHPEPDQPISIK